MSNVIPFVRVPAAEKPQRYVYLVTGGYDAQAGYWVVGAYTSARAAIARKREINRDKPASDWNDYSVMKMKLG